MKVYSEMLILLIFEIVIMKNYILSFKEDKIEISLLRLKYDFIT